MFIKVSDLQSANTFKSETQKGYWIILYYANWCPHCQSMKPDWQRFSDKYKSPSSNINVAEVESEYLGMTGEQHKKNVEGFPTIISCNRGNKTANFAGPRTTEDIDKFANDNFKGVKGSSNLNKLLRNNKKAKKSKTKKTKKVKKVKTGSKTKKSKTGSKTKK